MVKKRNSEVSDVSQIQFVITGNAAKGMMQERKIEKCEVLEAKPRESRRNRLTDTSARVDGLHSLQRRDCRCTTFSPGRAARDRRVPSQRWYRVFQLITEIDSDCIISSSIWAQFIDATLLLYSTIRS